MGALLKFEAIKLLRSKLFWIGFALIFLMVAVVYAGFQWRKHHPRKVRVERMTFDSTQLLSGPWFSYLVESPMVLLFLPLLVTAVGSSMIAGEARQGTLRMMLIRPLSRTQVLAAKAAVLIAYTLLVFGFMAGLAMAVGFGEFRLRGEMFVLSVEKQRLFIIPAAQSLERMWMSFALAVPTLLSVAMLALMFSVIFEQATAATLATLGVYYASMIMDEIPLSFMDVVQPFLPTHYMFSWRTVYYPKIVDGRQVWDAPDWDRISADLFGLCIWTVGYLMVAIMVFSRKDVKA